MEYKMNTNTMELNMNEMEQANGGWNFSNLIFSMSGGAVAGGLAGSVGGPIGAIFCCAAGTIAAGVTYRKFSSSEYDG